MGRGIRPTWLDMMPNDSEHEVANAAAGTAAAGGSTSSAWPLFGRGMRQLAWPVAICLFAGIFLPDFAFNLLGSSAEARADYLRFDLWNPLATAAFDTLALCWLLANLRKAHWLLLTIAAFSLLDSHLSMVGDYLSHWLREHSTSDFTVEQQLWPDLVAQLTYGLYTGMTVVAALRLPRRLGFLTPLIAVVLEYAAAATWFIPRWDHIPHRFLLLPLANGLGFGLCVWAAVEFQRHKRLSAERLSEARSSNGAYIFGMAFSRLLGTSLLSADTSVPEEVRPFIVAAGIAGVLVSSIILLVFLYRAWKSIETPYSMPAGSVIGKLFIPFFNLYWIFQAVPGFAREYQNCGHYLGIELPRVPRGWLIALSVCLLIAAPGMVVLAAILSANGAFYLVESVITVCAVLTLARISDAVNRLPVKLPDPQSAVTQPA